MVTAVKNLTAYNAGMNVDFTQSAPELARALIGCELLVEHKGRLVGGIIIETEAYTADDPASHSFRGQTARNAAMFMAPGTLYVYRIYGMHLCLNIVCGNYDGQAVLLRALRPTTGVVEMMRRRGVSAEKNLTSGPARLTQALGIDQSYNGIPAAERLMIRRADGEPSIVASPRIGISKAIDVPWRFRLDE